MPEVVTGGVGLLDYDNDGLLDVFCVNGGSLDPTVTHRPGNKLYRNLGNFYFQEGTTNSGLPSFLPGAEQAVVEDWFNEDLPGIFVTQAGKPPVL